MTAGIAEASDAYAVDLFAPPDPLRPILPTHLKAIRAFHQQVASMSELDVGRMPERFRRYLRVTQAIASDAELASHIEVHRRYRREWLAIIANARRRGFPWVAPTRPLALAQGAAR